nr:MAG TPA: HOLLIDAY JUNCTION RESOLVASE [Caudoviricetes sp.]
MSKSNVYELDANLRARKKCILAFDPGSVNMGISLVEISKKGTPRVIANATMMHPIHDIPSFMAQQRAFVNEVRMWIEQFKPRAIVAERFQSRGLRGATVECVSMMLGILSTLDLPVLFITASTWKNQYQKRFGVNLRDVYKEIRTTPHQLDASLIGHFGLEVALKTKFDLDLDVIIKNVKNTALNGVKRK